MHAINKLTQNRSIKYSEEIDTAYNINSIHVLPILPIYDSKLLTLFIL